MFDFVVFCLLSFSYGCFRSRYPPGHVPTPVVEAISAILKDIDRDLPYGVFGSYGWSGEAVGAMQNRLKDAGFKSAFDPISLKFKPTDDMIEVLSTCR